MESVCIHVCSILSEITLFFVFFLLMSRYVKQLYKYIYIVCMCVNVQEVTLLRRLRLCLLTGPDTRGSSSSLRKTEKERLKC